MTGTEGAGIEEMVVMATSFPQHSAGAASVWGHGVGQVLMHLACLYVGMGGK